MAMDADRRREVVAMLRRAEAYFMKFPGSEDVASMHHDAAKALEEMGEAPPDAARQALRVEVTEAAMSEALKIYGDAVRARQIFDAALAAPSVLAPKPSAASMEEENRRLKMEIEHVRICLHDVQRSAPGAKTMANGLLGRLEKRLDRALHPHAPWCRDPSHEGACLPDNDGVEDDS